MQLVCKKNWILANVKCSHYLQSTEADWKSNNIKRHTVSCFIFFYWCYFSEFRELDKLHLKAKKVSILKDFLASFPYMSYKTCTCDRIIQGLIDFGMLDAKHNFWPDFYENLKTKRGSITRSEMQMIEKKIINSSKSCWKRVIYLRNFMMLFGFQNKG